MRQKGMLGLGLCCLLSKVRLSLQTKKYVLTFYPAYGLDVTAAISWSNAIESGRSQSSAVTDHF